MSALLNYVRRFVRMINRKRLKNTDFSLITNNCVGGIISHDMHLQFRSPTVNLSFDNADFILFCEHLDYYLSLPIMEVFTDKDYPVGVLHGDYGDVRLFFMHYKTFDDAVKKWNERRRRINHDNCYVIMEAQHCAADLLERFDKLPYQNKVVLTVGKHPNIKNSFPIEGDFYGEQYWPGKLLTYPKFGVRRYLDAFDYVSFFNKGIIKKRYV